MRSLYRAPKTFLALACAGLTACFHSGTHDAHGAQSDALSVNVTEVFHMRRTVSSEHTVTTDLYIHPVVPYSYRTEDIFVQVSPDDLISEAKEGLFVADLPIDITGEVLTWGERELGTAADVDRIDFKNGGVFVDDALLFGPEAYQR